MIRAVVLVLVGVAAVHAGSRCSGNPPSYNGKPCASTTNYVDAHKGACGCGPEGGDAQFDWNRSKHVAAINQEQFGSGTWCGGACGRCYKLEATGGFVDGQGSSGSGSIVVMVTNLCPNIAPNLSWCNQEGGQGNQYGYHVHFDLEDGAGQVSAMGWNNPEVTYESVSCSSGGGQTPTDSEYSQCQCGGGGK